MLLSSPIIVGEGGGGGFGAAGMLFITYFAISIGDKQKQERIYKRNKVEGINGVIIAAASAAAAAAAASGATGGEFDFGVDPSLDPELAMAIRLSMEEERARQEARKKEQDGGAAGGGMCPFVLF